MKLLKTFSLYTFVGFLNAGIGFLLLPLLTKYLTPVDYGIISLINTYVSFLIPIIGMSISGYIGVEYYNADIPKDQFPQVFSSVLLIPLIFALPLGALLFTFPSSFAALLEVPTIVCYFIIPLTLLVLYQEIFNSFLVMSKRAALFSISTLSKLIVEIPLSIFLIVFIGMQWEGRVFAWAIMAGIVSLVGFYFFNHWKLITSKIQTKYIYSAFTFGLPLILHQIGKFAVDQSDRLFLAKMISVKEMGIYSVGYQVGMIMLILISAFSNFFSPYLLERLNNISNEKKVEIIKVSYGFVSLLLFSLILITLLTPTLFTYFINERFASGAKYVFWIGLGYFFWGIYIVFAGYIFFLKRNKILGYLAILNVSLNLAGNYFFITWYGAIGAAYATCLSYAVVSLIVAVVSQRLYPMPWFKFKY